MHPNLLIVDGERATREGLRSALEEDFDVYLASNNSEALASPEDRGHPAFADRLALWRN